MKIAATTSCNMMAVIAEVEVDEEETVSSLKTALADEELDVPELVEVVQNMFKVTAQITQLAEEGLPFDIHTSILPKNSALEICSFTSIGRNHNPPDTENSMISVGSRAGAAQLCATKSAYKDHNPIIGTSFNSVRCITSDEFNKAIDVEEIVKSAMADYMECGGDDAADEFYLEASGKNQLQIRITSSVSRMYDNELDEETVVKSAVEAFMECDEVDEDFVTPFVNKSEPKLGKDLVVYANEQLYTVVESNGKIDDANKLNEFATNLDKEVSEIPNFKWGDIDMRTFFCKYLSRIGCHNQCKTMINLPIQRLKMSWKTTDNIDDNGVYLLRHLEVYMGEREGHWNCGLSTRNRVVLQY
ncbi:hypothetical protein SASPL_137874 [Salvia splendens]|uniref:Uncharacterized protein n=1 Tax=Salvia splendens TaxID=180675 RepID=A0A8X8WUH0_SALSN|nr:hypothetical protein SASPL_137874 [Salvia splendens]